MIRFFEILPGTLTWATLIGAPVLAYFHPVWVSVYIILFDLYWFLKAGNVALHLMHSYARLKVHRRIDWIGCLNKLSDLDEFRFELSVLAARAENKKLKTFYQEQLGRINQIPFDRDLDWKRLYHLIILPTVNEDVSVLASSIESYIAASYPKDRMIFVLATEERTREVTRSKIEYLTNNYSDKFYKFIVTVHPDNVPGEARVKGANITYAAKEAQKIFDELTIPYEDVLVSAFDADTTVANNYFAQLSFNFLTVKKPLQTSYQPMPMFHNNIWDTPAIARVIATSSSFWQLVEASRPDRLITFSSHAMSFKTLVDVNFWRTDIIPDDSHIFWQCFIHFSGDYRTQPLFTTVSMDAVLGETYYETLVAQYKQKRRWAWGVTEMSLVFPEFFKSNKIPLWKRLLYAERLLEGHYFWATASIMIAVLGWLPLIFGGDRFGQTVLAVNLPFLTRIIMSIATFFLIFSVYVNLVLLPPKPSQYSRWKYFSMIFQWIFAPIVSSVFGSAPAIDAQTRLMFGKYMEFFITPKHRKHPLKLEQLEQVRVK
ncbi:MAG: glycosyltransferase family 2 protein [Candidatus Doudnabacteria bacterium]|nr:glycosyltransferase family 2 protein [Candidatus Doudnabacteria bacterium]